MVDLKLFTPHTNEKNYCFNSRVENIKAKNVIDIIIFIIFSLFWYVVTKVGANEDIIL